MDQAVTNWPLVSSSELPVEPIALGLLSVYPG